MSSESDILVQVEQLENPLFNTDGYKLNHILQFPENTQYVYSNLTPRSSKWFKGTSLIEKDEQRVTWVGLQGFIKKFLIHDFQKNFFGLNKEYATEYLFNVIKNYVGEQPKLFESICELYDLNYLPIHIKSLPEGSNVNYGVPVLTITNTKPEFYWLVGYLEDILSNQLWKASTIASIAYNYRLICEWYAEETCDNNLHVPFQCHDFSQRGLSGVEDSRYNSIGHLASFIGSDNIPSVAMAQSLYWSGNSYMYSMTIPATEHSVMCMYGKDNERETYRRLISDVHPSGFVSIVSDTWDLWNVVDNILPSLKEEIMSRDGKVVIRPDSGDPVKILCGYDIGVDLIDNGNGEYIDVCGYFGGKNEVIKLGVTRGFNKSSLKGLIQTLWENFGGTINTKGYKVLDEHIGVIYGDSITIERAEKILEKLEELSFASSNIVFGVGSYTYNYITRDTQGYAVKATHAIVDSKAVDMIKDPITDSGIKKSRSGLLRVEYEDGEFVCYDKQTKEQEKQGCLKTVFLNGKLDEETNLEDIRHRVANNVAEFMGFEVENDYDLIEFMGKNKPIKTSILEYDDWGETFEEIYLINGKKYKLVVFYDYNGMDVEFPQGGLEKL